MLKLLLIFPVLILLLNFRYRSLNNPYKLYMVFGKKGSGKSTYLCKLAKSYLKKKFIVYTNMTDCRIPGVRLIDPEKLGDFVPEPRSCVLLDEVGMLYDNRNFQEKILPNFKLSTIRDSPCEEASTSPIFFVIGRTRESQGNKALTKNIRSVKSLSFLSTSKDWEAR